MWARGWGYGAVRPRVRCVETFSNLNTKVIIVSVLPPFHLAIKDLK